MEIMENNRMDGDDWFTAIVIVFVLLFGLGALVTFGGYLLLVLVPFALIYAFIADAIDARSQKNDWSPKN